MKNQGRKTAVRSAWALLSVLLVMALAGCGTATPASTTPPAGATTETPAVTTPEPAPALNLDEELTFDFYWAPTNYSGLITGWGGKILKDKFNIKINIISPVISGQAIYQTRSAAGNLGDLVLLNNTDQLKESVQAGLFIDMTDLLGKYGQNLKKFSAGAIASTQEMLGTDKIYVIPDGVSTKLPTDPLPTFDGAVVATQSGGAAYLRWDVYKAIGAPKIGTMEDLLPVFQQMQEKYPASISGKKTYAVSFFKDWDGYAMKAIYESFPSMYGYQFAPGTSTILTYGDPTELKTQRLDDDNGLYYRTLKFYYQANQMGLVDPDSPSLTWDTTCEKVKDGQTLFYWWSWASISQYNRLAYGNADEPTGFAFVPMDDAKYFDVGYNPLGQWGEYIGIGPKAKAPERLVALLDWLATPEGEEILAAGPKGLTWEEKDGQPVHTELGLQAKNDGEVKVPEEWGGGAMKESLALPMMILSYETNPNYNIPYSHDLWPSFMEKAATKLDKDWQAAYGAENMLDYITKHNMLSVAPGNSYVAPTDSEDIKNARSQCSSVVVNTSWQMVFAKDQAAFDSLWADMKTQLQGLGWESIYAVDMQNAKDYNAACMKTINDSKK
jgi:multiple sugar transport system substrate-binding protein/putative aldouronate transport system substrate-binding protein